MMVSNKGSSFSPLAWRWRNTLVFHHEGILM